MPCIYLHDPSRFPNYTVALALAGLSVAADPDKADGLLLPGGGDLAPERLGCDSALCRDVNRDRDERELQLCDQFLKQNKPILGICRGAQVLALALGGSLTPHVDGHGGNDDGSDRFHDTRTAGLLTSLYGPCCVVNTHHHQAVAALPEDCAILQVSLDGVVEAFGHRQKPVLAVQWHPERLCGPYARADAADGALIFGWLRSVCGGSL